MDLQEPLLPYLKLIWHPSENGLSIEGNIGDPDRAIWVLDKAREALERQLHPHKRELIVPAYAGRA